MNIQYDLENNNSDIFNNISEDTQDFIKQDTDQSYSDHDDSNATVFMSYATAKDIDGKVVNVLQDTNLNNWIVPQEDNKKNTHNKDFNLGLKLKEIGDKFYKSKDLKKRDLLFKRFL